MMVKPARIHYYAKNISLADEHNHHPAGGCSSRVVASCTHNMVGALDEGENLVLELWVEVDGLSIFAPRRNRWNIYW